jgi:hypothetical protein
LAQSRFVCESHRDFPLYDLRTTDGCHADFGGVRQVERAPSKQRSCRPQLCAGNFARHLLIFSTLCDVNYITTGENVMHIPVKRVADSAARRDFIGGSDARIIMGQDEKALIRLWQEKRG